MAPAISTFTGTARMMARAVMVPRGVASFTSGPDQSIDSTGVESVTGKPLALAATRAP